MDKIDSITISTERKRGQHLQAEDRGAIQALKAQGCSNRAIAKILGCSPTTVGNELKRGTPPRKSNKGRASGVAGSAFGDRKASSLQISRIIG
jgi:IS30 family transposase